MVYEVYLLGAPELGCRVPPTEPLLIVVVRPNAELWWWMLWVLLELLTHLQRPTPQVEQGVPRRSVRLFLFCSTLSTWKACLCLLLLLLKHRSSIVDSDSVAALIRRAREHAKLFLSWWLASARANHVGKQRYMGHEQNNRLSQLVYCATCNLQPAIEL